MKRKTFLEELQEAKACRYAVGAFNIFDRHLGRAIRTVAKSI